MILVAGGTGRLGTLVVHALADRGEKVRVLTRDPARAAHLGGAAEIVTGDIRTPTSLQAAVAGAQTVISAVHGFVGPGRVTPQSVDRQGNFDLIGIAAAHGATVVMMSVVGACPDSPLELSRAKYAAESRLRESGTPWTIVRSTPFLETWVELLSAGYIFGRGANPVNFVPVQDVAAAVVKVVADPEWRGRILEIGGQTLSLNELAALIEQLAPSGGRHRHIPRTALRLMAPLARPARAALVMDTADMRLPVAPRPADLPVTDVRSALCAALGAHEPR